MNEKIEIVNEIKQVNEKINEIWNSIKKDDLEQIKKYWNDNVAEEFKNKLIENDKTINTIKKNLELLSELIKNEK